MSVDSLSFFLFFLYFKCWTWQELEEDPELRANVNIYRRARAAGEMSEAMYGQLLCRLGKSFRPCSSCRCGVGVIVLRSLVCSLSDWLYSDGLGLPRAVPSSPHRTEMGDEDRPPEIPLDELLDGLTLGPGANVVRVNAERALQLAQEDDSVSDAGSMAFEAQDDADFGDEESAPARGGKRGGAAGGATAAAAAAAAPSAAGGAAGGSRGAKSKAGKR
jgi:hypothetical protein